MRMICLRGALRQYHGRDSRRVGASKDCRNNQTTLPFGHFLNDIASVRNRANRYHDDPCFEWIDFEYAEILVWEQGENDCTQQQKLGESENFVRNDSRRQTFEESLKLEQEQARNRQCRSDPKLPAINQSAHEIGREAGHFCSNSGKI